MAQLERQGGLAVARGPASSLRSSYGRWFALGALIVASACMTSSTQLTSSPSPDLSRPIAGESLQGHVRLPADLPRLPEEELVADAVTSTGFDIRLISESKFQEVLGIRYPSRGFGGMLAGSPARIEMLILDAPVRDLRVCPAGTSQNPYSFTVVIDGRTVGSGGGLKQTYFAVSDRFFFLTSEARLRDALREKLTLSIPTC